MAIARAAGAPPGSTAAVGTPHLAIAGSALRPLNTAETAEIWLTGLPSGHLSAIENDEWRFGGILSRLGEQSRTAQ